MRKVYVLLDETEPVEDAILGIYSSKKKAETMLTFLRVSYNLSENQDRFRIIIEVIN